MKYIFLILVLFFSSFKALGDDCKSLVEIGAPPEKTTLLCFNENSEFATEYTAKIGVFLLSMEDYDLARKFLELAASRNNALAQHFLARMYYTGSGVDIDYLKASKFYIKSAEQGLNESQYHAALIYFKGHGVKQSDEIAVSWLIKAADNGHKEAQFSIGILYMNGAGGFDVNYAKSFYYLKLAAEQGHKASQQQLATMFYFGRGTLKDYVYAHMWFNVASVDGDDELRQLRDGVEPFMTNEQIAEAQKLARECLQKSLKGC